MHLTSPADLFEAATTSYRVEELRYFLIGGETSWLESLRIINSQQRTWAEREVTFYALGASHALSIRHRDLRVTELLSCRDGFSKDQCFAEMSAAEPFEVSTVIRDMHYSFRLTLHDLQGDDILLGPYPDEGQMAVAYPRQQEFASPVTRIGWLIEPTVLRLETLHTYPEERRGVRTESVIEIG
jgi:hypothetical protein